MSSNVVALALGVALLAGVGMYFVVKEKPADPAERTSRAAADTELTDKIDRLLKENAALRKKIADLDEQAKALEPEREGAKPVTTKPEAPDGEITDEEIEKGIKAFGKRFQSILTGKGEKAVADLRALIKRSPRVLEKVKQTWTDASQDFGTRVIAAHILGQSGDKEAIEALAATLRDPDLGTFDHRIASHALAFSDAAGIELLLLEVARKHKEAGASANAAFGLARRGIDEGIELYMQATDQAFEEGQPEALGYLSGLPMIGEKAKPHVRKRLETYTNETALLSLIEIVKSFKDAEALPQLNKLAYDASRPVSIQKAAKGAIEALTKKAPASK